MVSAMQLRPVRFQLLLRVFLVGDAFLDRLSESDIFRGFAIELAASLNVEIRKLVGDWRGKMCAGNYNQHCNWSHHHCSPYRGRP
jgi:hypothetical protein